MNKTNRGITLVALVITIIVLIILAGVSINAVMNGGLIENAKEAQNYYTEEKVAEEEAINYLEKIAGKQMQEIEDEKIQKDFAANGITYKFKYGYLTGINISGFNTETVETAEENLKGKYALYNMDSDGDGEADDITDKASTYVATGMVVKRIADNKEIGRVVVFGDITGNNGPDGCIDAMDEIAIQKCLEGINHREEYKILAMDVNGDNIIEYQDSKYLIDKNIPAQNREVADIDLITMVDYKSVQERYIQALKDKNNGYSIEKSGDSYILKGVTIGTVTETLKSALPENTVIKINKKGNAYTEYTDEAIIAGKYKIYVLSEYLGASLEVEIADFVIE